jgi:hypothetical protein
MMARIVSRILFSMGMYTWLKLIKELGVTSVSFEAARVEVFAEENRIICLRKRWLLVLNLVSNVSWVSQIFVNFIEHVL